MENQNQKFPATTEKSVEVGQSSVEMPAQTVNSDSDRQNLSTLERLGWVGSITLGSIVVFGGGGYFLDSLWGTKPWLLIAGMVLAYIGTQVMVYRKMTRLVKKKRQ
jgi:F0F1-type ATP synthase assembly protein I